MSPISPIDDSDLTGRTVDGFRIDSLLGAGGMGRVYKAFDTGLQRWVAMKIVAPVLESAEFFTRFEREARALSAVNHSNVAHIYSIGRYRERPYYVMELIGGHSLESILDQGGHLAGARGLRYLLEAASGLNAAFRQGIIHRDIKPSNLMIDAYDHLKILDFGLARTLADDSSLTPSAMAIGTPRYMSPEQALARPTDHRSDIYSLGATFYHLFAGFAPFDADTPVALLLHHVNSALPPLKSRNSRVPQSICTIIETMMAKDPEQRYPTYDDLIAEVTRAIAGSVRADAPTTPMPWRKSQQLSVTDQVKQLVMAVPPWGRALVVLAIVLAVMIGLKNRADEDKVAAEESTTASVDRQGERARDDSSSESGRSAESSGMQGERGDRSGSPGVIITPTGTFDPSKMIGMAFHAKSMANMRRLSMLLETWKAQNESLPDTLETIISAYEIHIQERIDGWKNPIIYEQIDPQKYRLISAGADGSAGTGDDIVIENGYVIQGEQEFQPPRLQ